MMTFALIGMVVGLVLALTGGGGAIIGLPLLIHGSGMTIRDASVLILPVVAVGALISTVLQSDTIRWRIAAGVAVFSIPISGLASLIKPYLSAHLIAGTIVGVVGWGVVQTWRHLPDREFRPPIPSVGGVAFVGGISGVLTAITGLGGGVVLVPVMVRILGLSIADAISSSLILVICNSMVAFVAQYAGLTSLQPMALISMVIGVLLSNVGVQFIRMRCVGDCSRWLSKIGYSVVALISIVLILIKH